MTRMKKGWVVTALVSLAVFMGMAASSLFAQGGNAAPTSEGFRSVQQQASSEVRSNGEQEREKTQAEQKSEENKKLARQIQENLTASMLMGETIAAQQKAETARTEARSAEDEIVVRTYSLKYINWRELVNAAKFYLVEWTGQDNTLTVRILRKNIPDFEAVLKKLDVEKKNVMFRVHTIIAARDNPPDFFKKPETTTIDNRDLKIALDEMKGLWNFKHYWVDAPSFLTIKDGAGGSHFKLVSSLLDYADFGMYLLNVRVSGDEPGKRVITLGEIKLELNTNTPNAQRNSTLIDTQEISLKEKGYLIVGVSGLETGWNGLALILVISAEIK